MEKVDFSKPTRQSIFAILIIIQKYIRVIIRQIWPLVIIFFVGGSGNRKTYLIYGIAVLGLFSMIRAIIAYFKFYFYIKNDELIIHKGILKKSTLNIPFDRIQTVNFQQNLLHRFLGVVKLEVDTAGSKGSEFSFDALQSPVAESLRDILLSAKKSKPVLANTSESIPQEETLEKKTILRLSIADLLKIGITQNHLRSGGLIFFGLFWMYDNIREFYDADSQLEEAFENSIQLGLLVLLTLAILFILLSFLISLGRTVIKYYDMHFWREGNRYKLISGLFTRRENAILDSKLQIISWSNNPLKKILKYYDVKMKQASSVQVVGSKSLSIPGCYMHHIDFIKQNWIGEAAFQNLLPNKLSIHFLYRRIYFRMLFSTVLVAISFLTGSISWQILSFLTIPYFIWTSWLAYQKSSYSMNEEVLYISSGMFGDAHAMMPLYKIQSVKLHQSPYQSRRQLSSLQIFSAAGSLKIPYIPLESANQIMDILLCKVEKDKRSWM